MSETRILVAGSTTRLPQAVEAARRSWLDTISAVGEWSRRIASWFQEEGAVPEYVELTRGLRTAAETRLALVRLAFRLSGARRVELDLNDGPAGAPRRMATWPPPGRPDGPDEDESVRRPAANPGSPLCLSLRFGGRTHGTLRLVPAGRRRWSPRLVRRLTTLCALAAAVERVAGGAGEDDATRDPVTGTYNTAFLTAFLTHALAQGRRRGEPLTLLCAGADWLEGVREEHGTEIADPALRRMARALTATLRASDVVARLDDSRLIAVLPAAALPDAMRVAESARRAILEAGLTAATPAPLTSSIGVATYPDHAADVGRLLAAAREALARARAQGPGSIVAAPRPTQPAATSIIRSVG
jgi:diguanylate cyclase (GGDEF)-like protein